MDWEQPLHFKWQAIARVRGEEELSLSFPSTCSLVFFRVLLVRDFSWYLLRAHHRSALPCKWKLTYGFRNSRVFGLPTRGILGTLRNYDGDGDGNGNVKKAIGSMSKTTILHVSCITLFCTFLYRPCITRTWIEQFVSLLGNGIG